MKKITVVIVIISITYFVLGYTLVIFGFFDKSQYYNLSAIIGSIASVSGLLSFVYSGIKRKDIESVGIEYFKEVIKAADNLSNKEQELLQKEKDLSKKEKEIQKLEYQKKELEYLVQKSSMIIFLKDQHSKISERISEIVKAKELRNLYSQLENLEMQISALDDEIERDENVEMLEKIMKEVKNHRMVVKKKNFAARFFEFFDVDDTVK